MGGSLEECVHIAGINKFFSLAEMLDYDTVFLGPAVDSEKLVDKIIEEKPDIVALSYRLTPENASKHFVKLKKRIQDKGLQDITYLFGGTSPVVEEAEKSGIFKKCFTGEEGENGVISYLQGEAKGSEKRYSQHILERIDFSRPFPVLRAHFGQPTIKETVEGVQKIAEAEALDVISLGTDQDTQANFFHPERQSPDRKGAGGVPVRTREDFERIYKASRRGNLPLLRVYAGTDDMIQLAQLYVDTINNAWAAIPIFWFNKMDGRGPHDLRSSIKMHLDTIKWHADADIPVEILESHHWSMRDAPDNIAVASAVLGAYVSKELGVNNFIQQYMFNTPVNTSFTNDLAKMLAKKEMIQDLEDEDFKVYHQSRAGLVSFPASVDGGYGQLASSTMLQMQLNPDIVHIVNYCEAHHAATADDVITSSELVKQVIKNHLRGTPDMTINKDVQERKDQLKAQATRILEGIYEVQLKGRIDADNLYQIISEGIFDAPQLKNNPYALGEIKSVCRDGGYYES